MYIKTSPQTKDIVGHIEFSEITGILTGIPSSDKYEARLRNFTSSAIILNTDRSIMFSPYTKEWMLNVHKAVVHRDWDITEAWNRDEI